MAPPSWRLDITPHAKRDLGRLAKADRRRIGKALDGLITNPPTGDITKLAGTTDEFRLRVGSWRVIFRRDGAARTAVVLSIESRPNAYRR